jgi:hypothetical protein
VNAGRTNKAILTRQELEVPRSAADMLPWVREAAARFDTKRLRAEAREGKHFAGVLMNEALPIALFANRYYASSSQVTISHVIGSQNYDAVVADSRACPDPIQFVEVTTTLMSYEDSLRLELMNSQGHAPAYGAVSAIGPKHNRTAISAQSIALEHSTIVNDHLQRVQSAVRKKAGKQYEPYTALIVAIDDYVPFERPADRAALDTLVRSVLLPLLSGTNIHLLALEGSKQTHLVYKVV